MNTLPLALLASLVSLAVTAPAQSVAIFPDEYAAVADGPFNSPNLPLAFGTSRVQVLYDRQDLQIPSGHSITRIGFRQDAALTNIDTGRTLQLEIRMGWSTNTPTSMVVDFDNNYVGPPVTVFGPAVFVLPNLRDAASPLPNGRLWIPLTTPFSYVPSNRNLVVEYRIYGTSGGGSSFNYRLDRADFYSPTTAGPAGCPHTGGGPATLSFDPVRPGQTFTASLTAAPGNSPGVLALNLGTGLVAPYSLTSVFGGISPACTGQLSPVGLATVGGATTSSGTTTWSFAIPNNPVFSDFVISGQGLFLEFFAPGGLIVSNGFQVLTGALPRTAIVAFGGAPTTATAGTKSNNYCPVAFFDHQ